MQFKVAKLTKHNIRLNKKIELDFCLQDGEILAVLGENSAGKSTCLKLLAGTLQADSGNIFLDNKNISQNLSAFQQRIAYLPEEMGFNKNLNLEYYLNFFIANAGIEKSKRQWRLEQIVQEFNLEKKLHYKIAELSKGFKQRLALACVLLKQPKILILDEATQGLDFVQKQEFYKIIRTKQIQNISIISTHYLQEALQLANKILILKNFEVVFFGTIEQLLQLAQKFTMTKSTFNLNYDLDDSLLAQVNLIENFLNFGDLENATSI